MDCKNIKLAILASGRGSNAVNIIEHSKNISNIEIVAVVSDIKEALVLERAHERGIPITAFPIEKEAFESFKEAKREQEKKLISFFKERDVDYILLAGYMRILSADFLQAFYDSEMKVSKVINIHPALLPSFPGKSGYEDAFSYGVKISGVTIHFVDSGVDSGPVILQETFPRFDTDSLEDFNKRGLEVEYQLYKKVLDLISQDKIKTSNSIDSKRQYVSLENE